MIAPAAVGNQQVEGHVGRPAAPEQQLAEQRTPGIVEHHELAVEDMPLRQEIQHPLEALQPAVARDQPATNGVGRGPEAIELGLEHPIGMVEGFWSLGGVDQCQHRCRPTSPPRRISLGY
jgi:hypothetical protein